MKALRVASPLGVEALPLQRTVSRIESLAGKTIGEVWNGVFKGDVTFPLIRAMLQRKFPGLKIIPYTEFPHAPGNDNPSDQRERARQIAARARELGCDAIVSGNGA